ncbi:MAG: SprT-like domain-containing protein [Thiocapsa sp.]|nr:SprT-like domain-containing protein [Thiocapsa sp.]MCG6896583.1 SprT-like domain-containing protein [Thiocapsa sp.]MCG6985703.1 SprT-like domain-containing protein [Thiocapsa sp.]
MNDPSNLRTPIEQVLARTHSLLREAEDWLHLPMPPTEVRFDLHGLAAGQARLEIAGRALIRYNPTLLHRHPAEFLRETVPHEVGHIVAFIRHGTRIRPHGAEWQTIMRHFGAYPSRCHRFDTSTLRARTLRRFSYRCGCRTHQLSSIRHNRVLAAGVVYLCPRCRQPLRPDPGHQP